MPSMGVHRARHVDVGEQNADFLGPLQDRPGGVGRGGLQDREPCILQHVDGDHAHHALVLDDEDCVGR